MKPEAWRPGALDAIATRSTDGRRIVIKVVNYEAQPNTLLVRLQGSAGTGEGHGKSLHSHCRAFGRAVPGAAAEDSPCRNHPAVRADPDD